MDRFAEAIRYVRRGFGIRSRESTLRAGQGITSEENDMLGILASHPVGCRMGGLAEQAQCHPSNAVRSIRSLVRQGLVVKQPAPDDGRGTIVTLTPVGWELAKQIRLRRRELYQKMQRELRPGGVQELLDALETLNHVLENIAPKN